jgi:hypothetical protein
MSGIMAGVRLPGGMPVWRGWWLVLQHGAGRPSGGIPVTDARHAELHAVVHEAARRANLPPPRAVSLGGTAQVGIRGNLLTVGLPLVWGLSAEQLRAVVAHEVALPPGGHRRLARELLHRRRRAREPDDGDFLLATRSLVEAAEQVRDAAAIDAIGGGLAAVEDAALALFRAEAVRDAFERFTAAEAIRVIDGKRLRVADLHDGWRERLRSDGGPGPGWDPDVPLKRIPSEHPGLSGELLDVAEEADGYHTGLDPAAVPTDPLSPAELRRLAGDLDESDGEDGWVDYADLPVEAYSRTVERTARRHVEAVEALLGGPPADRDELVDVLLGRTGEVCAAEGAPVNPEAGASMVADLIEYTMVKRGWKRRHPAVAWRMVSPDGVAVDVGASLHRPAELRRLLNGGSAAAA